MSRRSRRGSLAAALALTCASSSAWAIDPKQPSSPPELREFFLPELYISSANVPLADVLDELPNATAWRDYLAARADAAGEVQAFIDPRSGAATNLLGAYPLIPGSGDGNAVTLAALSARLGRPLTAVDAEVVADAARRFLAEHGELLGVDLTQLGELVATPVNADLWHVSAGQRLSGVPVRHARLVVTISHGNVVLAGTEVWGRVELDPAPRVAAADALAAGLAYAGLGSAPGAVVAPPRLEIVPIAPPEHQVGEGFGGPVGSGYRHRLVWTYEVAAPPAHARWEAMVDAHDGELIAFQDVNHYVEREIVGGVYPSTNTGICPDADRCGTMQSGWPMPFADTGLAAPNDFTNSAGTFDWSSGNVTTTLNGRFVRIQDNCGAISATAAGDLDLGGTNNQHDCTTPGFGGAGNTAASRSGFYELNRIKEQARGWLPVNPWLNQVLTSNMNILATCNAFYSPVNGTVNFYRSGGGCRNTGEIAGVFDHEWGHAMDDNDSGGSLSNSSEAYADIAMIYRLQTSCVGYGFWATVNNGCGQTADGTGFNANEAQTGPLHCDLDCSGVRDADFALHNPNTPDTALGFVCSSCVASSGPCGRQVHCAAAPTRQAAWDLVARDLPAAPFNYDAQSAFLIGSKLFYQGSGNVGLWHSCTCGGTSDGCGATNGYMQWLAADDDNGNLSNGTPHMTALHAAFNRHGIACNTPAPVNSGCAAGPSTAPVLTVTPGDSQVSLSWTTSPGATRYWVFRTEGHAGCNFGKVLIAEVTGTTYVDTEVANGRTYYYNVVAAGSSAACYTRVSTCVEATPQQQVTFPLAVAVDGSGTVTSAPAGISCPADCSESYVQGTSVTLTPAAAAGWQFTGWSGDCTGTGACVVAMTAARSVTATFTQLFPLTAAVTGSGTVTSAPAGISCPTDCSESYFDGTSVTLTPAAAAGWQFTGWSGDCTGTGACVVAMTAARSVTATFTQLFPLTAAVTGSGTVTSDPPGIACPADCNEDYLDGAGVLLTATPGAGWSFTGWSGDCTGTADCMVTMSAARSVTASFVQLFGLEVVVTGPGSVVSDPPGIACPADCAEVFVDGTAVALTATPDAGAQFVGWGGDCTGTADCDLTMTAPRLVEAAFDTMPFLDGFETGDTSRWSNQVP